VTVLEREVARPHLDSAPVSPPPNIAALGSRAQRRSSLALCLAGAALSLASIALSPDWQGALGAALGLLMLAVAWSDSHRFVVPDVLSGLAFALGVVNGVVTSPEGELAGGLSALSRAGLMAMMFFTVRVAYRQIRKREGLGLGDVKLAAAAGAWVSLTMMPIVIEMAAVSGLAMYLWRQTKRRRIPRANSRIPFGAFFALAIWSGWLFDTGIANFG
jgi:leader peptidase (prepilin peptidase)/N-methyltransferase